MSRFDSEQERYDNLVPEWYWDKYFGSNDGHPDEERLNQVENDLWEELSESDMTEDEYYERIGLISDYRAGLITLKELNDSLAKINKII